MAASEADRESYSMPQKIEFDERKYDIRESML
jgi:hypothetical protein